MNTPPASVSTPFRGPDEALREARRRASELYRTLQAEIDARGLNGPAVGFYVRRGGMVYGLYALGYALLLGDPGLPLRLLGIGLVAFATVQGSFLAHDAGHEAISRSRAWNRTFGLLFLTITGGQAFGHWVHNHNRHHANPNDQARDPDVQGGPFSLYPRDALRKRGLYRLLTAHQHWLLWPLLSLQPLSIKKDTWIFLAKNPRAARVDLVGVIAHYALWFVPPVLLFGAATAVANYLAMSWIIGLYIIAVFPTRPFGVHPMDPDEQLPFLVQAVSTTRNLSGGWVASFLCGGLNHQIEHHLVPRVPACRLGRVRAIVRPILMEQGLPYREQGWWAAARDLQRHLASMARYARRPRPGVRLEG